AAQRARARGAGRGGRWAEDGLRHAGWRLDRRPIGAVGRGPAGAGRHVGRPVRSGRGAPLVHRVSVRPARRATWTLGGAAIPGLAAGLYVTAPRQRTCGGAHETVTRMKGLRLAPRA